LGTPFDIGSHSLFLGKSICSAYGNNNEEYWVGCYISWDCGHHSPFGIKIKLMIMRWITKFYFPKPILDLLRIEIIPYVDLWMLIHFISGYLLFLFFGVGKGSTILSLLIAYELFEQYLFKKKLVSKEPILNVVLDVVVGYGGYLFAGG